MSLLKGLDISYWQNKPDLSALKSKYGLSFVAIKASEGKSLEDPHFTVNWANAKKAKLIRIAYHFARPEASSAEQQADFFLSIVKPSGSDIVCLDLEASELSQAKTNAWAKAFSKRIRAKTPGIKIWLYMGHGYSSNGTGKGLSAYFDFWWYPQYPSDKPTTSWPKSFNPWIGSPNNTGWDKPHMWQWSRKFADKFDADVTWLGAADLVKKSTASPTVGTKRVNTAPSWNQVSSLLWKQKATYAKGRTGENVNDYTRWYGMNGPFCFMGISWTLAHAGSSEKAGLDLIEGKKDYVPYIRNIKGYHPGHSGMKVGAIVAVNNFNHIGFCTKISGSTFELFSFNTTHNGSDDAVWNKTYPLSYASGYVNLAYGSASQEDDFMAEYVSVDKTDKSRKEALKSGVWTTIYFDKNNDGDASKHHSNGDYPSLITANSGRYDYNGTISLRISGLPKGVEGQIRCIHTDAKTNEIKSHCYLTEFLGSSADTFVTHNAVGRVPTGQKMRIEVVHFGPDSTNADPAVIAGSVRINARKVD